MRYQIKNKKTGEVTEYATGAEYNAALKELWASGAKETDIDAKAIVDDTPDGKPRAARLLLAKPGAKPAKIPRVRNRGTYFIAPSVARCATKEEAIAELQKHAGGEPIGEPIVIRGRELTLKVQYRLTGV